MSISNLKNDQFSECRFRIDVKIVLFSLILSIINKYEHFFEEEQEMEEVSAAWTWMAKLLQS